MEYAKTASHILKFSWMDHAIQINVEATKSCLYPENVSHVILIQALLPTDFSALRCSAAVTEEVMIHLAHVLIANLLREDKLMELADLIGAQTGR